MFSLRQVGVCVHTMLRRKLFLLGIKRDLRCVCGWHLLWHFCGILSVYLHNLQQRILLGNIWS